jgi:subtilisin family serine protease
MKCCIALLCFVIAAKSYAAESLSQAVPLLLITVVDSGPRVQPRGYHRLGYQLSLGAANAVSALEKDYPLKKIDGWPIHVLDRYCAVMAVSGNVDAKALLSKLQQDARVDIAQSLQTFEVHAGYNDPYFALQYGKHAAQIEQWHQRATGRGVRIAVIDTGIDRTHPDLQAHIHIARNFIDGDTEFDKDLHGTAVAGIIAATANNGVGIVGLAPDAELLALKACWPLVAGKIAARCNSFTLAKALSFAIEQRADVINLSLGGPQDPLLTQLLRLALQRDMLIVAAQDQRNEFPASVSGVIAVKASIGSDFIAYSLVQGGEAVEADASELLSTSPGGHYDFFSGSSMAAARVAGLSALMRQGQQHFSSAQLLENLNSWLAPIQEPAPVMAQAHLPR